MLKIVHQITLTCQVPRPNVGIKSLVCESFTNFIFLKTLLILRLMNGKQYLKFSLGTEKNSLLINNLTDIQPWLCAKITMGKRRFSFP